jgi:hypothetical protein
VPSRSLLDMSSSSNFVNCPNRLGIVPDSAFEFRYSSFRFALLPIAAGTVPVKRLLLKLMSSKFVLETKLSIRPIILLPFNSRNFRVGGSWKKSNDVIPQKMAEKFLSLRKKLTSNGNTPLRGILLRTKLITCLKSGSLSSAQNTPSYKHHGGVLEVSYLVTVVFQPKETSIGLFLAMLISSASSFVGNGEGMLVLGFMVGPNVGSAALAW